MKLKETFTYTGIDVEAVYKLITDQAFRLESAENQGSRDIDISVEGAADAATLVIVRTQDSDMPDFVKKLTGNDVKVRQTEVWGEADAAGTRKADVKVSIIGQPAEMVGVASLSRTADGTDFTLEGDVKVSIPFLGKKIEPEVAKAIRGSLREEVEYGMTKL
jgi:hypothetical protein